MLLVRESSLVIHIVSVSASAWTLEILDEEHDLKVQRSVLAMIASKNFDAKDHVDETAGKHCSCIVQTYVAPEALEDETRIVIAVGDASTIIIETGQRESPTRE